MYRVLIVDDEVYIVDWISNLLETQTEWELDICCAYSGDEALNWLNRAKIDIVLTDICMPEMSGIELAENVRENWPQCKVILLTAHAEFNYAYEGIKNNVTGYILKNEDDAKILEEINKAVKLLDSEMNIQRLIDDVQEHLNESMSIARNELLANILKGNYTDISDMFMQLENIGVIFKPDSPFLMLMGWLENIPYDLTVHERLQQLEKVKLIFEHYLGKHICCYNMEHRFNRLVWLMQPKTDIGLKSPDKIPDEFYEHAVIIIRGMLETIQQSCLETIGLTISFTLHDSPVDSDQLYKMLLSLDCLINLHMADESGFIISGKCMVDYIEDVDFMDADILETYTTDRISERLNNLLNTGRHREFLKEMNKLCNALSACKNWHSNKAQELYYSAAVVISTYINQSRLAGQIAFKIGLTGLFRPYEAGSWKNAADYLSQLSTMILQMQKKDGSCILERIIKKLKEYIDNHITEDVSLTRLSEITGYNPSYLSRVFRQNTGITLNEYICKQKLTVITELLLDDCLSVNDIAIKAGFNSRTYFNNFFRRMTGISPQQYRKNLLRVNRSE